MNESTAFFGPEDARSHVLLLRNWGFRPNEHCGADPTTVNGVSSIKVHSRLLALLSQEASKAGSRQVSFSQNLSLNTCVKGPHNMSFFLKCCHRTRPSNQADVPRASLELHVAVGRPSYTSHLGISNRHLCNTRTLARAQGASMQMHTRTTKRGF